MFKGYFKKRKIKKVARKLPQDLKVRYGRKKYYSKDQVDASMKRNNINYDDGDNYYIYAMYCSRKTYNKINSDTEKCDYSTIRNEVSDTLFNGIPVFSFSTLLAESSSPSFIGGANDGALGGGDSGYSGGNDDGGGGGD